MSYTKNDFLNELKNMGLVSTDTIMIHSAFSTIKEIEGGAKTILDALCDFFSDGLVLIPSHTWATVYRTGDIFVKKDANSCVGYLTNCAILDKRFIRSNHPTHSVMAYGKNAKKYIKNDDYAKTPADPEGSFGKLKYGAKILFIGTPLNRNTFIHSIEEEFNVPDRLSEVRTYYTEVENGNRIEFKLQSHSCSFSSDISMNYKKLLPKMLEKNIAKKVKLADSESYLVDAKACYEYVCELLKQDVHYFDRMEE